MKNYNPKDPNNLHYSVLFQESIDSLALKPGLTVVDCTVNRGGHAEAIASQIGKTGTLVVFDLDKEALTYSYEKLKKMPNAPKVFAVHKNPSSGGDQKQSKKYERNYKARKNSNDPKNKTHQSTYYCVITKKRGKQKSYI